MEQLAERLRDELKAEIDAGLLGVSYYEDEDVGHVFRSEWATEKYDPEQVDEIVRDIQLEALGYGSLKARQEESLHATVRIYEEMLDVAMPITETSGVVFALDRDGDYDLRELVRVADEYIAESEFERPVVNGRQM